MMLFPMVLQAYAPHMQLGDWQIVIFVDRGRNRISVERWHSSERPYHPLESTGEVLRINTGIRAFRRQIPVLAGALEDLNTAGLTDEQVVNAVFHVLTRLYEAANKPDEVGPDDGGSQGDFLGERREEALAALALVLH